MSLYKEYIEEITRRKVLETDEFFVEYFTEDDCFVVKNLYVIPSKRNGKLSSEIKQFIYSTAKELGCDLVVGELHVCNPHFEQQMNNYLNDGYIVSKSDTNKKTFIARKKLR